MGSVASTRVRSESYVGIRRTRREFPCDTDANLRTLDAAMGGAFYTYVLECVQISQYPIADILNRGKSEPGDGGALGNRGLLFGEIAESP